MRGHPVLTAAVMGAAVVTDAAGGMKVDKGKSEGSAVCRVDPAVAAIMAAGAKRPPAREFMMTTPPLKRRSGLSRSRSTVAGCGCIRRTSCGRGYTRKLASAAASVGPRQDKDQHRFAIWGCRTSALLEGHGRARPMT